MEGKQKTKKASTKWLFQTAGITEVGLTMQVVSATSCWMQSWIRDSPALGVISKYAIRQKAADAVYHHFTDAGTAECTVVYSGNEHISPYKVFSVLQEYSTFFSVGVMV